MHLLQQKKTIKLKLFFTEEFINVTSWVWCSSSFDLFFYFFFSNAHGWWRATLWNNICRISIAEPAMHAGGHQGVVRVLEWHPVSGCSELAEPTAVQRLRGLCKPTRSSPGAKLHLPEPGSCGNLCVTQISAWSTGCRTELRLRAEQTTSQKDEQETGPSFGQIVFKSPHLIETRRDLLLCLISSANGGGYSPHSLALSEYLTVQILKAE